MIILDTGWQTARPYRCVTETTRRVEFAEDTSEEEIIAFQAKMEDELPGGQKRWVKRNELTLIAYVYCDSGD